jgi:hypothetical protein
MRTVRNGAAISASFGVLRTALLGDYVQRSMYEIIYTEQITGGQTTKTECSHHTNQNY